MVSDSDKSGIFKLIDKIIKLPWQNLVVIGAIFLVGYGIFCFSGVAQPDAKKIEALETKISALESTITSLRETILVSNNTIRSLNERLETYEKILNYRIENLENKVGIKYKEGTQTNEKE